MSTYKPPSKPPLTVFNSSDFDYQDQGLSFAYAEANYCNVNDDSDLYQTTRLNGIANTTKLTDVSYSSSVTSVANTLQPTGTFAPSSACKLDLTQSDTFGNCTNSYMAGYQAGNIGGNSDGTTCVGYQAGMTNTGNATKGMTCFGFKAGRLHTGVTDATGDGLTAIGYNACTATTSLGCTAVGTSALLSNTLETLNTAVGQSALRSITGTDATTQNNTAVGAQCCRLFTGGARNTCVGSQSMNATGGTALNDNTAVGFSSLINATTISTTHCIQNSCLGSQSGADLTTGSNNLLLGYQAGTSSSPSGSLTTQNNRVCLGNSSITNLYSQVALTVVSDARDKYDIQDLDINGLDYINALQPKLYKMNDRSKYFESQVTGQDEEGNDIYETVPITNDGSKADPFYSVGFLAQDVQAIEANLDLPNELVVNSINSDKLGMLKENLIPFLVDAIRRQNDQINDLLARIETLQGL